MWCFLLSLVSNWSDEFFFLVDVTGIFGEKENPSPHRLKKIFYQRCSVLSCNRLFTLCRVNYGATTKLYPVSLSVNSRKGDVLHLASVITYFTNSCKNSFYIYSRNHQKIQRSFPNRVLEEPGKEHGGPLLLWQPLGKWLEQRQQRQRRHHFKIEIQVTLANFAFIPQCGRSIREQNWLERRSSKEEEWNAYRRVLTFFTKPWIWSFHVVVCRGRKRNVPKHITHMHSDCVCSLIKPDVSSVSPSSGFSLTKG